jgi:hypothetical protein
MAVIGMGIAARKKENARVKFCNECGLLPRRITHFQVNM